VDDGCGGITDCGVCCQPKTACGAGECGPVADGCGGTLNCPPCVVSTPTPEPSPTPVPSSRYLILIDGFGSASLLNGAGERDGSVHGVRDAFAAIVEQIRADDPPVNVLYFSYRLGRRLDAGRDPLGAWTGDAGYAGPSEPLYAAFDVTDRPLNEHAAGLDWIVRDVRSRQPEAWFDIVGFGVGGVIALIWVANRIAEDDEIVGAARRTVVLNAPLGGTHPALPASPEVRRELAWRGLDLGSGRALRELSSGSTSYLSGLAGALTAADVTSIECADDYLVNGRRVPGLAAELDSSGLGVWLGKGTVSVAGSGRLLAVEGETRASDLLGSHRQILDGAGSAAVAVRDHLARILVP
jgi:hypothetical protein